MTMLAEALPDTTDAMLSEARSHLKNARLAEAAAACIQLLGIAPDNIDALYTLAVTQRMQRQIPAALATLSQLLATDPGYGRAWQERGHCFRDSGRAEEAIAAYQRAVAHNGALGASWRLLSEMHDAAGRDGLEAECVLLHSGGDVVRPVDCRMDQARAQIRHADRLADRVVEPFPDSLGADTKCRVSANTAKQGRRRTTVSRKFHRVARHQPRFLCRQHLH